MEQETGQVARVTARTAVYTRPRLLTYQDHLPLHRRRRKVQEPQHGSLGQVLAPAHHHRAYCAQTPVAPVHDRPSQDTPHCTGARIDDAAHGIIEFGVGVTAKKFAGASNICIN